MNVLSWLLGRILKLPPAQTYQVVVHKDLAVPMRDDVVLRADHYAPRGGAGKLPTVLIRGHTGSAVAGSSGGS